MGRNRSSNEAAPKGPGRKARKQPAPELPAALGKLMFLM